MGLTGFLGFVLTLPLALIGAWRARLLTWWPALLVAGGQVSAQALPGGYGLLTWAVTLVALAYALARIPASSASFPRDDSSPLSREADLPARHQGTGKALVWG